ncbi:MAG: helicase-related protein, partial [Pyrinomonadaceae bacterium]
HEPPGPVVQELINRLDELGNLDTLWQNDSKFSRLAERLTAFCKESPDEKLVVFSYFKDTLEYLAERLQSLGIPSLVLSGAQGIDKDAVLAAFENASGPKVLLSSEVGSEGIDLQFCRVLVNYDLPWNPMRVEQRIGRLDRIGQRADKILVWNLMYDETIDSRIYDRLFVRLQIFERALGGLEGILGDEIVKLTADLMRGKLTAVEEEERIEQTAQTLVNKRNMEERLEQDAATLVGHSDYILNQIRAARELHRWISGEDIKAYVLPFLKDRYPDCVIQQLRTDDPLLYRIRLSNEAKAAFEKFLRDQKLSIGTGLIRYDSALVECRFENRVTPERPWLSPENISQFHPLVRFVSSVFSSEKSAAYPVVAATLSKFEVPEIQSGEYVFAIQRWSAIGLTIRETLQFLAKPIGDGEMLEQELAERLVTTASLRGRDWLEAKNVIDLSAAEAIAVGLCLDIGRSRFERNRAQVQDEMADRANVQRTTIERHLEHQHTRYETIRTQHLARAATARQADDKLGQSRFENLAKAAETNLQKVLNRFSREMIRIKAGSEVQTFCDDICLGVLSVR